MAIWTSLQTVDFDMTDPDFWTIAAPGPTNSATRFEWTSQNGLDYMLIGRDFTYANGVPSGGDVDELIIFSGGSPVAHVYGGSSFPIFADAGVLFANGMAGFFDHLLRDGDDINGGSGGEIIAGGAGDDDIDAGGGSDTIIWNTGDGTDTVDGGDGADTLILNSDSTVYGIHGEAGFVHFADRNEPSNPDQVRAQNIETLVVDLDESTQLTIANGLDGLLDELIFRGGENADVLTATYADVALTIEGRDGDDTLNGGVKDDIIDGGDGNDVIDGHAGSDVIDAGAGHDTVFWNETAPGPVGGVVVEGGDDTIFGGAGNDEVFLNYSSYADTLNAATLRTAGGGTVLVDQINGDNVVLQDIEILNIDGGEKTAEFTIQDLAGSSLEKAQINFTSASRSDDLHASAYRGNIHAETGGGQDEIATGAGEDYVDAGSGHDTVDGGDNDDVLLGRSGNDTIIGGSGNDEISDGLGSDVIEAGSGDDIIAKSSSEVGDFDQIDGGSGADMADFAGFNAAIWANLSYSGFEAWTMDEIDLSGGTWREIADLNNIESLGATRYSDFLAGDAADNTFAFYSTAAGNGGLDHYDGRGGNDTADFSGASYAVWADLGYNAAEVWTKGAENLSTGTWREIANLDNIENLGASDYSDDLRGDAGDNSFVFHSSDAGTGGFDRYDGRGGSDTADFSGASYAVWADLGYSGAEAWTKGGTDLAAGSWREIADVESVENLAGSDFADDLRGDASANVIAGGAGDDILTGRGGADTFEFRQGDGDDTVTDFTDGLELIRFHDVGSFGDLDITDSGAGAVIDYGADTITLAGVSAAELDVTDFDFIV